MSTMMFYLTHVEEGGITAFPRLGIGTRSDMQHTCTRLDMQHTSTR